MGGAEAFLNKDRLMTTDLTPPNPARFNLTSFADLLPSRAPIIGEDPGSFEGFHNGMMQSLLPVTPYEGVIAENLIAIEWELLQHRRMRDAGLRKVVRNYVSKAVVKREEAVHGAKLDEAWDAHEAKGGTEDDWEDPLPRCSWRSSIPKRIFFIRAARWH
jgi:hypothetical protein